MNKQALINWCFPVNDDQEPETEPISTKRFLFMSLVGLTIVILSKLLLD